MALETKGILATGLTGQGEERVSKKTSREIKITKIELVSKQKSRKLYLHLFRHRVSITFLGKNP